MGELDLISESSKSICAKEVIITKLAKRGSGHNSLDILRTITQVWEKNGDLIAEHDPAPAAFCISQMLTFAAYCVYHKIENPDAYDLEKWVKGKADDSE